MFRWNAVLSLCLLLPWAAAGQTTSRVWRVAYAPDAAYVGEKATFVLEGVPGQTVTATLNRVTLAARTFEAPSLELNLSLPEGGRLRIGDGDVSAEWEVLRPSRRPGLAETNGQLVVNGRPAILLADHRAPPKHDRRWETVSVIRRLLADPRPVVKSGLLAGGDFLPVHVRRRLDTFTSVHEGFWTLPETPVALYELHGLLIALDRLASSELLLVALSDRDHERGLPPLSFAIKLDWYLQAVRKRGIAHPYVAPPPFTARQRERFPHVWPQCRLSALSNRAGYVSFHESEVREPFSALAWLRPVMDRLGGSVRCE